MATEASGEARLTVYQEKSDGVRTRYPIRFDLGYLSKDDIFVYQGEHADYETQLGYSWVNDTEYELDSPLPKDEVFNVRRVVERDDMLYKFVTSSIHPQNIDNAYLQLLMIAQELMDGFGDRDGLGNIKNLLDMRGYNITNMADARDGERQDAVTKGQLDDNYEYVLATIAQLDQAVADASESATEAGDSAALAKIEADRAVAAAEAVIIDPQDGLSFQDAGTESPKDLQVDVLKQPEAPAAVGNDFVLVHTANGLYKVQVSNLVQVGSAYDVRGTVVLDNDANTGTVTDTVYNETYQITPTTNPGTNPEDGNAFTVVAPVVNNGITGATTNYEVGDIIMWAGGKWQQVAVSVTSWQGKSGNVDVELGDIGTDLIYVYNQTTMSLTDLLQNYVSMYVESNSSIDVPVLSGVQRPDSNSHPGKSMMHYETDVQGLIYYNPESNEWEEVGSGGLRQVIPLAYPHTAEANTHILADVSNDTSRVITIPDTLLVGKEVQINLVGWTGNPAVSVRIDVEPAQEWEHPSMATGDSMVLRGNQFVRLKVMPNGALKVTGCGGENQRVLKGTYELYTGPLVTGGQYVTLTGLASAYDEIRIYSESGGTVAVETYDVEEWLSGRAEYFWLSPYISSTSYAQAYEIQDNQFRVLAPAAGAGVYKVLGIRK